MTEPFASTNVYSTIGRDCRIREAREYEQRRLEASARTTIARQPNTSPMLCRRKPKRGTYAEFQLTHRSDIDHCRSLRPNRSLGDLASTARTMLLSRQTAKRGYHVSQKTLSTLPPVRADSVLAQNSGKSAIDRNHSRGCGIVRPQVYESMLQRKVDAGVLDDDVADTMAKTERSRLHTAPAGATRASNSSRRRYAADAFRCPATRLLSQATKEYSQQCVGSSGALPVPHGETMDDRLNMERYRAQKRLQASQQVDRLPAPGAASALARVSMPAEERRRILASRGATLCRSASGETVCLTAHQAELAKSVQARRKPRNGGTWAGSLLPVRASGE